MLAKFVYCALLIIVSVAVEECTCSGGASLPSIPLREALVIRSGGRAGRSAVHTDSQEALIVSGNWRAPIPGEIVSGPSGGEQKWERAVADTNGVLRVPALRGGYAYWPVESDRDQILLLEASGHNLVYVNSEVRTGDPYSYGYVRVPVQLHAGTNAFLFQCSRGTLKAQLTVPPGPLLINTNDSTLPDVIAGETGPLWGAVVLINASSKPITASLRVLGAKSSEQFVDLPALGLRKSAFVFSSTQPKSATNYQVVLQALDSASRQVYARSDLTLRVRRADQTYKRTFVSAIDGSVQYYAINPPAVGASDTPGFANGTTPRALFLSLHGAGVEASGQADAYSPKKWGYIVCPTNRRPYGFDWEEWGRWDALEVLGLAQALYKPDPSRVYLTGHSMGGHGTWQLGALFPDRFAVVAPSAGWVSFTSYADTNRTEATNLVQKLVRRASAASDTLLMVSNYLQEGVYILHGDADDNVPVSEARTMRRILGQFHRDFDFHEEPGAGHWWDASDEPGADCVDYAPLFDFFSRHDIPKDDELREVRFVTVNPAVSSRCHWVVVAAQQHCLESSSVLVRCDPGKARLVGTTENISKIWFGPPCLVGGRSVTIELDGQTLPSVHWPTNSGFALGSEPGLRLVKDEGQWHVDQPPDPSLKNPSRGGPFRQAFCNRMLFVYATQGTADENDWSFRKARYDAETFWYRGNGSVDLLTDMEYLESLNPKSSRSRKFANRPHLQDVRGRNVILYGHADCNAAWPILLSRSSVQVHRGTIQAGGRDLKSDELACLFLQPSPLDNGSLIGVVSGTGLPGLRLSERLPYFLSGAGIPDFIVIGTDMLSKGFDGVRAAGFFGQNWSVADGEFAWRE